MNLRKTAILSSFVALAGCANQFSQPTTFTPQEPVGLSQAEVRAALSGKSWNWTSPKNSGTTLYASDGTSLVEVKGKGTTTGKWQAKDGQLCESYSPAPFLPKGAPMTCQPITGSGNSFQVGQAQFTLA